MYKTQFQVEVPIRETRDEKEFKAPNPSSFEKKIVVALIII